LLRYPENNLFTLKTNTYWRFEAVGCEAHRFFFAVYRDANPVVVQSHSKPM